jgi:hypothetical protein
MNDKKQSIDGSSSFLGGMDLSRPKDLIEENTYHYAVNLWIKNNFQGLSTRPGIKECDIVFSTKKEEEVYRTGNIQGAGEYRSKYTKNNHLVVVVDGYIFDFERVRKSGRSLFISRILNSADRNNPDNLSCYVSKIPNGCIVNDGQSLPFIASSDYNRRSKPRAGEISVGKYGVYCQGRFFYSRPNGREIYVSDFDNPVSMQEAYDDNIYGFNLPSGDEITALGTHNILLDYATVGNFCFSSESGIFSVDVRGPRSEWGRTNSSKVGFVSNVAPGIGAVSHDSFESCNANLYFRTQNGISSLRKSQHRYNADDILQNSSIEIEAILGLDSKELISQTYTKKFSNKIITTVNPFLVRGFVAFNSMVVYSPSVVFSSRKEAQDVHDSVISGVRPWNIVHATDFHEDSLFINSYDCDGVNRLYEMRESFDCDYSNQFGALSIPSHLSTRSYNMGTSLVHKKANSSYAKIITDSQSSSVVGRSSGIAETTIGPNVFGPTKLKEANQRFFEESFVVNSTGLVSIQSVAIVAEQALNDVTNPTLTKPQSAKGKCCEASVTNYCISQK